MPESVQLGHNLRNFKLWFADLAAIHKYFGLAFECLGAMALGYLNWCALMMALLLPLSPALAQSTNDQIASDDFPYAKPYFENVGDLDAVPGGAVVAMTYTSDGYLWLGTQSGLVRYDGFSFKLYQHQQGDKQSLSGNFINALEGTADGMLWIGTVDSGISIFDPRTEQFIHHKNDPQDPNSLTAGSISDFVEDGTAVWIATQSGLNRFDRKTQRFERYLVNNNQRPDMDRIRSLHLDQSGRLWVGSWDGLRVAKNEHQGKSPIVFEEFVPPADSFAGHVISVMLAGPDGSMWLGTRQHGLIQLLSDGSTRRLQTTKTEATNQYAGLVSNRVQALAMPVAGQIWATSPNGLQIIDSQSLAVRQVLRRDKNVLGSVGFDAVGTILQDPSGMYWIGTWGAGLQKLQSNLAAVRGIRLDQDGTAGLSFADVHAVLELSNGEIWVGTGGNGIDVLDRQRGRIRGYRPASSGANASGLRDGVIIALRQDLAGMVWIGTQGGGLMRADPTTGEVINVGTPMTVSDLLIMRDGTLIVGSSRGVARVNLSTRRSNSEWDDSVFEWLRDSENKDVLGQINPLLEDRQGRLWMGSNDGLRVLLPGEKQLRIIKHNAKVANSLANNVVFGLTQGPDDTIWIATERGLERLVKFDAEQSSFLSIVTDPILKTSPGANLQVDDAGRVWSEHAIYDPRTEKFYPLSRADGIDVGTVWTNAFGRTHDGLMLVGGTEGLLVIDPKLFAAWNYQPKIAVNELRINGSVQTLARVFSDAVQSPAILQLATDERSFSVGLANLDFSQPNATKLSYQLAGFDPSWIDLPAGQGQASYSNLWPGQYRLLVRAKNRVGESSRHTLELQVLVKPKFWQTTWFVALSIFASLLTIFLLLRWRTYQLHERSVRLNNLVEKRTKELQASNAELKNSNQALKQAQSELIEAQQKLVLQEKMAASAQLVAGVAHEVNTPIGVALTAGSYLYEQSSRVRKALEDNQLKRSELSQFIADAESSSSLLSEHLQRAIAMLGQFKLVSMQKHFSQHQRAQLGDVILEIEPRLIESVRQVGAAWHCSEVPLVMLETQVDAIGLILQQLVQNACQHAFNSRNAPVASQVAESPKVGLTATYDAAKNEVSIAIADNGKGLSESELDHVFDAFYTTQRGNGHMGLGLHIAYNLAQARLLGSLQAVRGKTSGSEFVLKFPAQIVAESNDGKS